MLPICHCAAMVARTNKSLFLNILQTIYGELHEELAQSYFIDGSGERGLGSNQFGPVWNCKRSNRRRPAGGTGHNSECGNRCPPQAVDRPGGTLRGTVGGGGPLRDRKSRGQRKRVD